MGKKKPKRRVAYSSHHCGGQSSFLIDPLVHFKIEFECYDMMLYEPVMMVEDFRYKTIVLIGAPNIGRRSIKTRLLAEEPDKYADVTARN
jgi:hypothetical protein